MLNDSVVERPGLLGREDDVDLHRVASDRCEELEQALGSFDIARLAPLVQHRHNPADGDHPFSKFFLQVLRDAGVGHAVLIETERAYPDPGLIGVAPITLQSVQAERAADTSVTR